MSTMPLTLRHWPSLFFQVYFLSKIWSSIIGFRLEETPSNVKSCLPFGHILEEFNTILFLLAQNNNNNNQWKA